ncbi:triose-phosphate isomerase [Candidatus Saccharibacteria bacterium]|nr:triose-phosphate isomerase [Candidatus Saccharibacteria bacterium]
MSATNDKKLIVGNWKMNMNVHESSIFVHKLSKEIAVHRDVEVVVAPTFLALQPVSLQIERRQFKLASQNLYWRDHGAYTGEVSASQLRGLVDYAIIGHSERRHVFHEHDKDIRSKVQAAIRNGIKPILCVGETAHQRAAGETTDVIHDQLIGGLANVTSEEFSHITVAYEPVWAIGTGNNALPDDAKKAARSIRRQIEHLYGRKSAESLRILYGGSVKSDNAASYLATEGIDGLLVGGASLSVHDFSVIVAAAHDMEND